MLGILRLSTPYDCARELEHALAESEVKAGPTTPLLYGYATIFIDFARTSKRERARSWCAAHSLTQSPQAT